MITVINKRTTTPPLKRKKEKQIVNSHVEPFLNPKKKKRKLKQQKFESFTVKEKKRVVAKF